MMKWGRRKSSSASSSSKPSFISHVSPFSWLSKFKKMRISTEPDPVRLKQKGVQNCPLVTSPQNSCGNGGRFYGGDNEAFWRLSFGEESHENKKGRDTLKSVVHNLDNGGRWNAEKRERREGTSKLRENERELGNERKLLNDKKISLEMDENNREKEFQNLRGRFERKAQRVLQEQVLRLEREAEDASTISVEKDVLQFESPRTIWTPRRHSLAHSVDFKNSIHRGMKEDHACNTQSIQKHERPNSLLTKELKTKTKKKSQSLHVSREIQRWKPKHSPHSPKVRVFSPRMVSKVEICKIKAIEDMRKAKLKMKKAKEKIMEESQGVDSFAVVKCSLDPQQDFRDSMVEMIREKQICQPDEMEELLACYLSLNSDEYHDLIIKVFREVWFDMKLDSMGVKLGKQCCYD